jgi:acyl carrier protein
MDQEPSIRLVPDWPRVKKLIAEKNGMSEAEVQNMANSSNSLDRVELVMMIEEVLGVRLPL